RAVNVIKRWESLLVGSHLKLGQGDEFLSQSIMFDFSVFYQHISIALDEALELFVLEEKSHNHVVNRKQSCRADEAAGHRSGVAYERVLDCVGKGQQHNQIKRVQLSQLALARKTQADD